MESVIQSLKGEQINHIQEMQAKEEEVEELKC
jgi:hypothetical protein